MVLNWNNSVLWVNQAVRVSISVKNKCKEWILPQQNKILLARRTANENIRIFISTYSKIVLVLILRDKQNCVANQAVALCGANCLKNKDCPSGR